MNDQNDIKSIDSDDLDNPDAHTVWEIIKKAFVNMKDRTSIIIWSSFVLLIIWGPRGYSALFNDDYLGNPLPNLSWGKELVSFVFGFFLVVVIPCCIIKFYFKERLADYGLGWKNSRIKLGIVALVLTLLICLPIFYAGTFDSEMKKEYPLFPHKPYAQENAIPPGDWGNFIIYELVYFLFFVNIEFIFRGYLLFGLYGPIREEGAPEPGRKMNKPRTFGKYAILFQMLAYTMWHLTKPAPEYYGTIIWGIATAAIMLKTRSIWPIVIAHWMLNIVVDLTLWLQLPQ